MPAPTGQLAENILYFARALRAAGIPIGSGTVLDALAALEAAGIGTREDFYWTLHAVFVKRHEHSLLFDQAFRIFFRKRAFLDKLMASLLPQAPPAAPDQPKPGAQRVEEALFARSRPTPASRCPIAKCCRRRISRRCRPPRSPPPRPRSGGWCWRSTR
jgi:uncharacterized protein